MSTLDRLTSWLLFVYLFLLPWQTRWIVRQGELAGGTWEYGTVSLYATDLLLLAAAVCWWARRGRAHQRSTVLAAGLGVVVIGALAIIPALDRIVSLTLALRLGAGLLMAWLVIAGPLSRRKLAVVIVASAVLQALFGLWQFFVQSIPTSKWLGLSGQLASESGTAVVDAGGRWLRAYGSLPHPNILAGVLVVGLAVAVYLYLTELRVRRLLSFGAVAVLAAGIVVTYSRSGWIATAAVLIGAVVASYVRQRSFTVPLRKVVSLTILMVLVTISFVPALVGVRVTGESELEVRSTEERSAQYIDAQTVFRRHWVTGTGLGGYTLSLANQVRPGEPSLSYQPVHNLFVLAAIELGVFGVVALLILLYEASSAVWPFGRSRVDPWLIVCFGLGLGVLVIAAFDHYLLSLPVGISLFWLTVGMMGRMNE